MARTLESGIALHSSVYILAKSVETCFVVLPRADPPETGAPDAHLPTSSVVRTTLDPTRAGKWLGGGEANERSIWPTPDQELVLRAALSEGEPAREAWNRWADASDIGRPDPVVVQLLPLVYRNLVDQGMEDPRLARLKPLYALTWASNQKTFEVLARTLALLDGEGVETLVFKGAALVPLHYRDPGVRGMGDFDLLVHPDRIPRATDALLGAGWKTFYWRPDLFEARFEHALPFVDGDGFSVDLHAHLLMACCGPGDDDPFWDASREAKIAGRPAHTLCPTDHLVHACVHGLNWVRIPPLRWITDAVTIVRTADRIDWNRVEALARELEVARPLAAALRYLERNQGVPVPDETIRRIERIPVSWLDRRRFDAWERNPRGRPLHRFVHHYAMFRRGVRDRSVVGRLRAVPAYVRFWAQADQLWKIPVRLTIKAVRLVGHRLGLYRYWDA